MVGRLTRDQFDMAIRKGQGRALQHVLEFGLDEVSDLVLAACLKLQAYDAQCEGTREQWLLQMIEHSPQYDYFVGKILAALGEENNTWDLLQLCGFTKELALRGDSHAYNALHDKVLQHISVVDTDDWLGIQELIELKGTDVVLELARAFGTRLMADSSCYPSNLCEYVEDPAMRSKVVQTLVDAAESDTIVRRYWNFISDDVDRQVCQQTIEEQFAESRKLVRSRVTVEMILTNSEVPRYLYYQFGRHATQDELQLVFENLLSATNEDECERLLRVFWKARMPKLSEQVFDWAISGNESLRSAALAALSNIQDKRVGDFARDLLASGNSLVVDSDLLRLLQLNYRNNDVDLMMTAIEGRGSELSDIHSIGLSILDIADESKSEELTPALLWVYENTPCSYCRHNSVSTLHNLGQLPAHIIDECRFDSYPDLRQLAESII